MNNNKGNDPSAAGLSFLEFSLFVLYDSKHVTRVELRHIFKSFRVLDRDQSGHASFSPRHRRPRPKRARLVFTSASPTATKAGAPHLIHTHAIDMPSAMPR